MPELCAGYLRYEALKKRAIKEEHNGPHYTEADFDADSDKAIELENHKLSGSPKETHE